MSNLPDGGWIVIGVNEEPPGEFKPVGLALSDIATFQQDHVQSHVNDYADPYVELTLSLLKLDEVGTFAVLTIAPFDRVPVICKKDGPEGLRAGAVYTRARKKHETIEIPSQTEMREILSRASLIEAQQRIRDAEQVGLISHSQPVPSAPEKFDEQLGDL
jgi:hypothetical protein